MKPFHCLVPAFWRARIWLWAFVLSSYTAVPWPADGVILYGTGDPGANTTAPTGNLAGSGWQYEGQFGGFLGTPIAPNYFITAKHIGGSVGQTFTFDGTSYTTTAVFPDSASDLQIWQVDGTFPIYAPLYSSAAGSEVNLALVVFGRGTQRGSAVNVGSDQHLGGWLLGASDGVERWGTNVIGSINNDPAYGALLRTPFDASGGANEGHLSVGDSGGAVFVFNGNTNQWELAGINLAVDGPFSTSSSGTNPFNAAMFDTAGLFAQDDFGNWVAAPNPSAFYATEIAAHEAFINSVVMRLVSVTSEMTHGSAGTFDIDLPLTGSAGIECRSSSSLGAGHYKMIFTFMNTLQSVASASVASGTGSGSSSTIGPNSNQYTVNLTGVTNAQNVTVSLTGVVDSTGAIGNFSRTMGVLIGDTNADGSVNSGDIAQTKSRSGQVVGSTNFRSDVTVDGNLNSADIGLVKSKSGTALP